MRNGKVSVMAVTDGPLSFVAAWPRTKGVGSPGGTMSKPNLHLCANDAIRLTVKEMRPSIDQSWMTLIPATTLTMPDVGEWLDFIGRVLKRYNACATACVGPQPKGLAKFQTEQLILFRDAIVKETVCP